MTIQDRAIALLAEAVRRSVPVGGADWFEETVGRLRSGGDDADLVRAFGLAPRRVGKAPAEVEPGEAGRIRPGWNPLGMRADEAARIVILLTVSGAADFPDRFARLARTADTAELVAIFRGLPLYPGPERFVGLAREGVRSGINPVFEAVAHRNPYPREQFDQAAWNQMILKALFIGSRLEPVQGLDERCNPDLAAMLVDYAEERWAAGRPVAPELWRCVRNYADERSRAALRRAGIDPQP